MIFHSTTPKKKLMTIRILIKLLNLNKLEKKIKEGKKKERRS
jgi:hypothetical protein